MADARPIGIFDSGIGGLTVLRAVASRLPSERLVYLGDTARVPYGTKSAATVTRYALECAGFLRARGVKALVVACNTASAVAIDAVREALEPHGVPVLGVIEPGAVEACRLSTNGRVGVIGTASTVRSGAYARAIAAIRPDFTVTSAACPLFVPLAEEGWTSPDDAAAAAAARRYLEKPLCEGIDTLILGCTHYPLLAGVIEATVASLRAEAGREGAGTRCTPPGEVSARPVTLVDSGAAVARDLEMALGRLGIAAEPLSPIGGVHPGAAGAPSREAEYHVTDDPERFREVGARFLGHAIEGPHLADLTRHAPHTMEEIR